MFSLTPLLLIENQAKWTAPWLAYISAKKAAKLIQDRAQDRAQGQGQLHLHLQWVKQPSSAHWLKQAIRQPLINNFNNNCGYCGEVLPTPNTSRFQQSSSRKKHSSKVRLAELETKHLPSGRNLHGPMPEPMLLIQM